MNPNKSHPLSSAIDKITFAAIHYKDSEDFVLQNQSGIQNPPSFGKACLKRKCEFIAGRLCAKQALAEHKVFEYQLINKADRSPEWPENMVGSITHTHNFAAAAIGSKSLFRGVGIDSEPPITTQRLEGLKSRLFLDRELLPKSHSHVDSRVYYTIIFSAKESLFKCIYPQTETFFGFHDACISNLDLQKGTFEYQLLKTLGPNHLKGKTGTGLFYAEELIHTAIVEKL